MPLSQVQVQFVNAAVRQQIERLILMRSQLDSFVLDFDNQQSELPTDGTILDDSADGTEPRPDAPQLTGLNVTQLRNFCENMRDQINSTALDQLVSLAVRDVNSIIRQ